MALPKQVQAQKDALEIYDQQVRDAQNAAIDDPKPDDNQTPPEPQAQIEQSPAPTPAQAPVVAPKSDEDDPDHPTWRKRYESLKGQYNTQVPALQQQVNQLTESVTRLTARLEAAPAKPAAVEPKQATELVTKNDVEAFGEDLVDLARRVAHDEFGRREAAYRTEIEALQTQLQEATGRVGEVVQNQAVSAGERFFDGLNRALPTWEDVQKTPECQAWLSSRIPGTTTVWNNALKDAAARYDVTAAVEVFNAFFEKHPTLNPKAPQAPAVNHELQRQIAPGKSAAPVTQSAQKRVYTPRDYEMESMRLMRLTQAGRVDDAQRLEAELSAAVAENRVRP
jgi:hypothetical protein